MPIKKQIYKIFSGHLGFDADAHLVQNIKEKCRLGYESKDKK